MERELLARLTAATQAIGLPDAVDLRDQLATNRSGRQWRTRSIYDLNGMCWHQELGWGSVEAVARYHTGPESHLVAGGVESISYSLAIRRNGQIVLCNDLDKSTWSQGYRGRKGDENAEFLAVMYEGLFKGSGVTTSSAGEPNDLQMLAGLLLWQQAKRIWKWQGNDLFGHFQFGKPACPGQSLQSIIEAVRFNSPKTPGFA